MPGGIMGGIMGGIPGGIPGGIMGGIPGGIAPPFAIRNIRLSYTPAMIQSLLE
jgi:hypothetical protein